jgi:hypothetical protein
MRQANACMEAYMLTLVAGLVMVIGGVAALIARPHVAEPIRIRVRPRRR